MRDQLAAKYIRGSGIEIGGFHCPVPVPAGVQVTYVDHMTPEELEANGEYKTQAKKCVIDDAEYLNLIPKESQDFVIACHVLEHCHRTLKTLVRWEQILKPGGIALIALPDASQCFDRNRPRTPWFHILLDYSQYSYHGEFIHYLDWFMNSELENLPYEKALEKAIIAYEARANIHFHCWDERGIQELFEKCQPIVGLKLLELVRNGSEMIGVLQK